LTDSSSYSLLGQPSIAFNTPGEKTPISFSKPTASIAELFPFMAEKVVEKNLNLSFSALKSLNSAADILFYINW
jgi:hypothetical protein